MSDLLRRLETQDRKLEELEQSMRKVFSEYSRTIDERISKGLEVVLESETKKRLEQSTAAEQTVATQLEPRLSQLGRVAHQDKDDGVAKEVILAVADIRANLDSISARVSKLESTAGFGPKLRTLKKTPAGP